jgi:kinetochore protein Nuf2
VIWKLAEKRRAVVYMATNPRQPHHHNLLILYTKLRSNFFTQKTMSYNPRMSIVPQQQNRGKKKEEDSDAFMRLVRNSLVSSAYVLT